MFRGEEFLGIAATLVEADEEVAWRTAISRAYYAAFWVAREVVEQGGVSPSRTAGEYSHESLWNMLTGDFNTSGKSIGEAGSTLKQLRVRADYRTRTINNVDARKAVVAATRLVADLRALT